MKKLFFFAALLIFTCSSFAQTAGISVGIMNNTNYTPYGFGINAEYNSELSNNFELIYLASLFYNNNNSSLGKRDYFAFPVCAGLRFYILRSFINPYISVEGGIGYTKYDLLSVRFIDPSYPPAGTKLEMDSYNKILLGIGSTIGTNINLNDNLKLNLNGRLYIQSDRNVDFVTYNAGVLFGI